MYFQRYLFVVQDSGEDWTWWRGLGKNVITKLCKIHAEAGEVEDKAALPICPAPHVVHMIRSLLRCTHIDTQHTTYTTHTHTYARTYTHLHIHTHTHTHKHTHKPTHTGTGAQRVFVVHLRS